MTATKKTTAESNLNPAEQIVAKKAELLAAQKSLHNGTLQNPHRIKAIKKDIARLLTKVNQEKGAK